MFVHSIIYTEIITEHICIFISRPINMKRLFRLLKFFVFVRIIYMGRTKFYKITSDLLVVVVVYIGWIKTNRINIFFLCIYSVRFYIFISHIRGDVSHRYLGIQDAYKYHFMRLNNTIVSNL
jgi:hypothetical protein